MRIKLRVYLQVLGLVLGLLLAQQSTHAESPTPENSIIKLQVGTKVITAELANTSEKRQQGLMFRDKLPQNHGMWFVFDYPDKYCMWMKNTPKDLSVAFVNKLGVIINIEQMQAHSLTLHCSSAPAVYALEMTKGWFRDNQIGPGAVIQSAAP